MKVTMIIFNDLTRQYTILNNSITITNLLNKPYNKLVIVSNNLTSYK